MGVPYRQGLEPGPRLRLLFFLLLFLSLLRALLLRLLVLVLINLLDYPIYMPKDVCRKASSQSHIVAPSKLGNIRSSVTLD